MSCEIVLVSCPVSPNMPTDRVFNSSTPKSDQHLTSPNNVTTESHINVMRVKEWSPTKEIIGY